ncbi:hypothetical protein Tco_1208673 [Tanacetum coccineum]
MGFKPQKKEYRHVPKKPNASSSNNKKKAVEPTIEVSNSNPFDILNSVDNDVEFGKLRLLDNDGNPLVPMGLVESDSEVEVVFDEIANLRISMSGKDGSDKVVILGLLLCVIIQPYMVRFWLVQLFELAHMVMLVQKESLIFRVSMFCMMGVCVLGFVVGSVRGLCDEGGLCWVIYFYDESYDGVILKVSYFDGCCMVHADDVCHSMDVMELDVIIDEMRFMAADLDRLFRMSLGSFLWKLAAKAIWKMLLKYSAWTMPILKV